MTKTIISFLLLLLPSGMFAQQRAGKTTHPTAVQVVLQPDHWNFKPGTVDFSTYKSVPAMKILNSPDTAVLKNLDFKDGTISYDIEPVDPNFTSFYFRRSSQQENECFYFRTALSGNGEAVQYAPFIDGINLWDMLPQYQTAAWFQRDQWNHVKLVISGKRMQVFVNDTSRPVLDIPQLEGNVWHGALAFSGRAIISNLVVQPGQTGGLSPEPLADITDNDPRYIRRWLVTAPEVVTTLTDYAYANAPGKDAAWKPIQAERNGLINLTRQLGGQRDRNRRISWLKTNIHSAVAQTRKLKLGFSDNVWVFLNGKYVYVGKNTYGSPIMKEPAGRCSVDNTSFDLPLAEGDNEVMIAVLNDFYGWGIIAQVDRFERLLFEK